MNLWRTCQKLLKYFNLQLDKILEDRETPLDTAVELAVKDDVLVERITGRLYHSESGRVYHSKFNPPKVFFQIYILN